MYIIWFVLTQLVVLFFNCERSHQVLITLWHFILLNLLNLLYILTQVLIAACLENESFKKTSLLVFRETLLTFARNNHRLCSVRKSVLRNFAKFKGKHPCQSPFLIKLQASLSTFLKKRLCHRCFPVNFVKFLRTPFLQNISGRLLVRLLS